MVMGIDSYGIDRAQKCSQAGAFGQAYIMSRDSGNILTMFCTYLCRNILI